jgi:hypothetical protein
MYTLTPSSIQVNEFRSRDMLANGARYRLIASARQSSNRELRPRGLRRVASTLSSARYLFASLASVAFGVSTN